MGRYERPSRLEDAAEILRGGGFTLLAGGTDFYPARVGRPIDEDILDLTAIAELNDIREEQDHWRLGALVTWSELIAAKLPPLFDGYKAAAREVGGVQIQNTGTLGGNLCNASPAADGTPNLMALDAAVEIQSSQSLRRMSVAQFVKGNRKTALLPGEMVSALIVPQPRRPARSAFVKLGARKYLVISIAMAAVMIEETPDRRVAEARVTVGSLSLVAQRLHGLESALKGEPLHRLAGLVKPEHFAGLAPIGDVRGTAEFRMSAAMEITRRALGALA